MKYEVVFIKVDDDDIPSNWVGRPFMHKDICLGTIVECMTNRIRPNPIDVRTFVAIVEMDMHEHLQFKAIKRESFEIWRARTMKEVNVGDIIVVPPCDEACGGRAVVSKVYEGMSAGKMVPFVCVEGQPSRGLNWGEWLSAEQERLEQSYGDIVAVPDGKEGIILDGHLWTRSVW